MPIKGFVGNMRECRCDLEGGSRVVGSICWHLIFRSIPSGAHQEGLVRGAQDLFFLDYDSSLG